MPHPMQMEGGKYGYIAAMLEAQIEYFASGARSRRYDPAHERYRLKKSSITEKVNKRPNLPEKI